MMCLLVRRHDHTQLRLILATRETAKPKLVVYIMDIKLDSVATIANKPIHAYTARMQKSHA